MIDWNSMILSPMQQAKFTQIDNKWVRINQNICLRIQDNQNYFKYLLLNTSPTDAQLREIHNNILFDKKLLRMQAMEILLEKRALLTDSQKKKLQLMILR